MDNIVPHNPLYPPTIVVSGSFDDLRSPQVRLLDEASRLGAVHVLLWSDAVVQALEGRPAHFPQAERSYLLQALRFVSQVTLVEHIPDRDHIPPVDCDHCEPDAWVVTEAQDSYAKRLHCASRGIHYRVVRAEELDGFPIRRFDALEESSGRKKVLVTGCYDWFHSGHVRFFEEVSELGDLFVVVGNDANLRHLKGPGHPLFSQEERRYMVHAVRHVKHTLVSSGSGWLDAEREIELIRPDIYAVNEDGDRPEKRRFCEQNGIEYVVLRRTPKAGLPQRASTALRGF